MNLDEFFKMSDKQFYDRLIQDVIDGSARIDNEIKTYDPERELERVVLSINYQDEKQQP